MVFSMADTPQYTPPIKDTNRDGILQGSELITQLNAEKEKGGTHTKSESVHGILDMLGVRDIAESYSAAVLAAQVIGQENLHTEGTILADAQQTASKKLEKQLTVMGDVILDDEFQKLIAQSKRDISQNNSFTPHEKEIRTAVLDDVNAYAHTLASTFPKGIKIAPEDVTSIMAHFAPIPVVIPITPMQPNGDPQNKVYKL